MDPQSPPKRMTRARAAAKANEAAMKSTKIVTAASRAKSTPAAATRSTLATKRKNESQDVADDSDADDLQPGTSRTTRTTRTRPKTNIEPIDKEPKADSGARAPRPRTKRVAQEPAKDESGKTTRARPKRIQSQTEAEDDAMLAEPPKKPTRPRPVAVSKPIAKKSVTFQEPEKENIAPPATKGKAGDSTEATGLRARPVRKPPIPTRAARTAAKPTPGAEKTMPLSPKKVTQMPVSKDASDDELATSEKTPLRPLSKILAKPSSGSRDEQDMARQPALSTILGTPARRAQPSPLKASMKSPPKKADIAATSEVALASQAPHEDVAPMKVSLLQSPPKRFQSSSRGLDFASKSVAGNSQSPFKGSMLKSPPKRFVSPQKVLASSNRPVPGISTSTREDLFTMPSTLTPFNRIIPASSTARMVDPFITAKTSRQDRDALEETSSYAAKGRLSIMLPQMTAPITEDDEEAVSVDDELNAELQISPTAVVRCEADSESSDMIVEAADSTGNGTCNSTSTTPPCSPPRHATQFLELRQKDVDPYESLDTDSEDELAGDFFQTRGYRASFVASPTPAAYFRTPGRPTATSSSISPSRDPRIGFTPLVKQFREWVAATPAPAVAESPEVESILAVDIVFGGDIEPALPAESPAESGFFEDEMCVLGVEESALETTISPEALAQPEEAALDPTFDDVKITDEDIALAAEADEMSLLEPEEVQKLVEPEDNISEASSQDYGDENAIPIDPALLPPTDGQEPGSSAQPFTPVRTVTRTVHTVCKVPLKPADESTPSPIKKRSASVSRLPVQRPRGPTRNATVISYSPTKEKDGLSQAEFAEAENQSFVAAPATPGLSEPWSTMGSPAQTPRRDPSPALLKGAIVFVDVHTSEGADASGIFVELLTQMGAKCVKSWSWNPTSPSNAEAPTSKIGITHVVYKDGGKRTIEKVRESGGVVQCVGVSWVLDCERENQWLDEAPYRVDTSMVPRGGGRRRKSMEPKALANLNGLLVPSPVKGSGTARDSHAAPNTPLRRRDSVQWVRTPPEQHDEQQQHDNWDVADLLTPVPPTPAPEAIADFAANVMPATPTAQLGFGADEDYNALLMQTCPPLKRQQQQATASLYPDLGHGVLSPEKDERVMMRLMAARRKSLQFAPKVGSPLSKAWN